MLARIHKSMRDKDKGFTLIELLVVMIIIGILAAIAIPVFLNQRQRAVETGMKSDARSIANNIETWFVDNQTYPTTVTKAAAPSTLVTIGPAGATAPTVRVNANTLVTYTTAGNAFCVRVANTVGAGTTFFSYDSDGGGLLARNVACT